MSDRRTAIAEALDKIEAEETEGKSPDTIQAEARPQNAPETKVEQTPETKLEATDEGDPANAQKTPAPTEAPAPATVVDKPPQSWKAAQKAKWSTLDPEVRSEIMRREREMDKALSTTAQDRQIASALKEVVQPYMARINALNVHPIKAVQELLKADHALSSTTGAQQAKYMAELIKQYKIDIVALDEALSASGSAPDPVQSRVEQLVQERLAPFAQFIEQQKTVQQQQIQQTQMTMEQQVAAMSADPQKYPEFEELRQDMADLIEIQAKKGVYLTLDQAYNRAIGMNPEVSARVAAKKANAQQLASAREASKRAQRARTASSSVNGAPTGGVGDQRVDPKDRRATIEAVWSQMEGR